MNYRPTQEALEFARKNGTQEQLSVAAGYRSSLASNNAACHKHTVRRFTKQTREECGIPAGIRLFERA